MPRLTAGVKTEINDPPVIYFPLRSQVERCLESSSWKIVPLPHGRGTAIREVSGTARESNRRNQEGKFFIASQGAEGRDVLPALSGDLEVKKHFSQDGAT